MNLAQFTINKLDATSRERALTNTESLELERAILAEDTGSGFSKRDAARAGFKRRHYEREG